MQATKKPFKKLVIIEPSETLKEYIDTKNSRGFLGRLHFMVYARHGRELMG
jgi:hypothetical protein